jgi:hypothetical protein
VGHVTASVSGLIVYEQCRLFQFNGVTFAVQCFKNHKATPFNNNSFFNILSYLQHKSNICEKISDLFFEWQIWGGLIKAMSRT